MQSVFLRPLRDLVSSAGHLFLKSSLALGLAGITGFTGATAAVVGNIDPLQIEIDASANLYPSGAPGFVDWVKDSLANTDPATLVDGVANGLSPNMTSAVGGKGHWYGVRLVDGIAGNDQNIFLTGGKENDLSTWNIGPGTVGSSKYDITQAYLANNSEKLFFGMERRGNNGTTAFDFEFNQMPPNASSPLVPVRTVGDVLFTFEMSGSGSSGSATPHYFRWNGTMFVEQLPPPPSLISSINNADIPAGPWGFVNVKGVWALGILERFTFAEASVKLSEAFPGLDLCNGAKAFVQVRTRSSATDTSDLKDTTKIFAFRFGGPDAVAALNTDCQAQVSYNSAGSKDSAGGSNLTYSWDFSAPAGVTLTGAGVTGPDASGVYHSTQPLGSLQVNHSAGIASALISVRLTVIQNNSAACTATTLASVTVPRPLHSVPAASTGCAAAFSFDGSASTGGPGFVYAWDFTPPAGVTLSGSGLSGPDAAGVYHSTAAAGSVNLGLPTGVDAASVGVKLTLSLSGCTDSSQTSVTVVRPVSSLVSLSLNCLAQFSFDSAGSTAGNGVTYSWDFIPPVGVTLGGAGITGPGADGLYHSTSASGLVDVALPVGSDAVTIMARLSTTRGACSTTAQRSVTVVRPLQVSINQKSANGSTLGVTLTGSAPTATSLQWQRLNASGVWMNISGATSASVTYSTFEADATPTVQAFNIDGEPFQGKLFQVQLRLHAERVIGGVTCAADSAPAALKKVIAVDP